MGNNNYGEVQDTFRTTQRRTSAGNVEEVQYYEKKNQKMIQQRTCVVDCRGQVYQSWALALGIFTFGTALITPFEVAFVRDSAVFFFPNMIFDVFFCCDICVNFRLTFESYDRELKVIKHVDSSWRIAKRYVLGWFLFDFLSVFPFELVGIGGVSSMRLLRCFRLVKSRLGKDPYM